MLNFDYYTPTRVVFGRNTEAETGKLIREQKCQKVLVHYGSGSVVRSGLLERIYASLKAEGMSDEYKPQRINENNGFQVKYNK